MAVWHAWNGIIKSIHLVNNYKKHLMCSVVEIEKRFLFILNLSLVIASDLYDAAAALKRSFLMFPNDFLV